MSQRSVCALSTSAGLIEATPNKSSLRYASNIPIGIFQTPHALSRRANRQNLFYDGGCRVGVDLHTSLKENIR